MISNSVLRINERYAPTELGFTSRGIPIDMAAASDSGSSVVWVRRWARLTITLLTSNGIVITLSQQVVGFVQRNTPLLLLGQHTCSICGYRTIEEQDRDRSVGPRDRRRGAAVMPVTCPPLLVWGQWGHERCTMKCTHLSGLMEGQSPAQAKTYAGLVGMQRMSLSQPQTESPPVLRSPTLPRWIENLFVPPSNDANTLKYRVKISRVTTRGTMITCLPLRLPRREPLRLLGDRHQ